MNLTNKKRMASKIGEQEKSKVNNGPTNSSEGFYIVNLLVDHVFPHSHCPLGVSFSVANHKTSFLLPKTGWYRV